MLFTCFPDTWSPCEADKLVLTWLNVLICRLDFHTFAATFAELEYVSAGNNVALPGPWNPASLNREPCEGFMYTIVATRG